jgi:hypothetical protein
MKMNKTKLKAIKKRLFSIISDSTMHGIPRLIKSKSLISKIIWAFFFVTCAAGCIYLILSSICTYLEYNDVTSIEIITEIPAKFPVVSICNLNKVLKKNPFVSEILDMFANLTSNDLKDFYIMNSLNNLNDTIKRSLSYSLNETIIQCSFNLIQCNITRDFTWFFSPFYGNCYSYNTGLDNLGNKLDIKEISKPGKINGFQLELFIGNPNEMLDYMVSSGYHILINNQTFKISIFEGYSISTGIETDIAINRLYTSLKPKPFSDCIELDKIDSFDSDLYRHIFKSNKTYRQNDCFELCLQKNIIETCNCYISSFDKLNGNIPCISNEQMYCQNKVYEKLFVEGKVIIECNKYCPLECYSISYELTSSFSSYPTRNYAKKSLLNNTIITSKFQNETLTYDLLKESVLSLNIYYDKLTYTGIKKDTKTELIDLISNIGGLLGLFLGISFLSFVEIIEIIIETLVIMFSKHKINN